MWQMELRAMFWLQRSFRQRHPSLLSLRCATSARLQEQRLLCESEHALPKILLSYVAHSTIVFLISDPHSRVLRRTITVVVRIAHQHWVARELWRSEWLTHLSKTMVTMQLSGACGMRRQVLDCVVSLSHWPD